MDGWNMTGFGWTWMGLFPVLLIIAIALVMRLFMREPGSQQIREEDSAREVLRRRFAAGEIGACATPYAEAVDAGHNAMEARVAADHGARYVDVVPWLCTDAVCPAIVNGLITRSDVQHVSENYAVWLSLAVGDATGLRD